MVIVSFGILAWLIMAFTKLPQIFHTGHILKINTPDTHGLKSGDYVFIRGQRVGIIDTIDFRNGDPNKGITITAKVDPDIRLKTNLKAIISSSGFIGSKKHLNLAFDGPLKTDPVSGETVEYFRPEEIIILSGEYQSTPAFTLPDKLTGALDNFGKLADSLNNLVSPGPGSRPASRPASRPGDIPAGLRGTVARMNRTLDSIHAVTGDENIRENLSAAIENLKEVSDEAGTLTRQLITSAEKLDAFMVKATEAMDKIESGDGSAGKLLNDPELYHNLVKSTEQMEELIKDLRQLVATWKAEGVKIKFK